MGFRAQRELLESVRKRKSSALTESEEGTESDREFSAFFDYQEGIEKRLLSVLEDPEVKTELDTIKSLAAASTKKMRKSLMREINSLPREERVGYLEDVQEFIENRIEDEGLSAIDLKWVLLLRSLRRT